MTDYYEDWVNETISFTGNLDKYKPEIRRGTRGSLGMDDSREYFEYLQKIRMELILCGAIKPICYECKSRNTTYADPLWTCDDCKYSWDSQRLHYKGI